jgi:hypothetical protein
VTRRRLRGKKKRSALKKIKIKNHIKLNDKHV